jgi:hypothetical protein
VRIFDLGATLVVLPLTWAASLTLPVAIAVFNSFVGHEITSIRNTPVEYFTLGPLSQRDETAVMSKSWMLELYISSGDVAKVSILGVRFSTTSILLVSLPGIAAVVATLTFGVLFDVT